MLPYKLLSEKDKEDLKAFCDLQANVKLDGTPIELDNDMRDVLESWDKGKRTLCRLLGGKLRHTFEAKLEPNTAVMLAEIAGMYDLDAVKFWGTRRLKREFEDNDRNRFVYGLTRHLAEIVHNRPKTDKLRDEVWCASASISDIFQPRTLLEGRITFPFYLHSPDTGRVVKFESGMKVMRAARKLAEVVGFECGEDFDAWRDAVSEATTCKGDMSAQVTLSIHPIDYLTMSDNACNWTSCMASLSGCFSNGTIEMMNSDMAVVAYVTCGQEPTFRYGSTRYPNKSWRCLFYVNKDIICSGRQYPFDNQAAEMACLGEIKRLAKDNLGWDYTYGPQEYHDNEVFHNNSYIRNGYHGKWHEHKIFLYTYAAMYNDLYRSNSTKHCYRNYVKRTRQFCISGPCTCLNCGKAIVRPHELYFSLNDDEDMDSRGDTPFCGSCEDDIYRKKERWRYARKL